MNPPDRWWRQTDVSMPMPVNGTVVAVVACGPGNEGPPQPLARQPRGARSCTRCARCGPAGDALHPAGPAGTWGWLARNHPSSNGRRWRGAGSVADAVGDGRGQPGPDVAPVVSHTHTGGGL